MTDPIQALIDAGAIPSTPFGPESRYNGVALGLFQRRPGDPVQVYVRRRFIPPRGAFDIFAAHIVTGLERPDLLAARYVSDPLLYWRIADANAVIDPNELTDTAGRRVEIPLAPGT